MEVGSLTPAQLCVSHGIACVASAMCLSSGTAGLALFCWDSQFTSVSTWCVHSGQAPRFALFHLFTLKKIS